MKSSQRRSMQVQSVIKIPARRGRAGVVKKGQQIRVVNVHGTQVVDCWPFNHVLFQAEMDLVICLSCCPQDLVPINAMKPRGARFEILGR